MKKINLKIKEQKSDECLAECVYSLLDYYEKPVQLERVIDFVSKGSDKLYDWEYKAGLLFVEESLKPTIYTNINYLFDPSWHGLSQEELILKTKEELKYFSKRYDEIKEEPDQKNFIFPNKLIASRYLKEIKTVVEYLEAGGCISFESISVDIIQEFIDKEVPLIVSLNPTLLHKMKRAYDFQPDDIRGITWGHVVLITGYNDKDFFLADPGGDFYAGEFEYTKNKNSVIESILRYNGQMLAVNKT